MSIPQNWVGACMAIVGSAHIAVAMHSLPGPIAVHLHMLPDLSVESEKIPWVGICLWKQLGNMWDIVGHIWDLEK